MNKVLLKPGQNLTIRSSVNFKESVNSAIQDHKVIELDMSNVNQVDVSTINFLIMAARGLKRRGGKMIIKNLSPDIKEIFLITQLNTFVDME